MTNNGSRLTKRNERMKVTMLRTAAGPEWIAPRGRVVEVADETGKAWVEQGAARKYVHEEDSKKTAGFQKPKDTNE